MVAPDELRAMDVNEIIALIEEKLGRGIPVDFSIRLAMLHGLKGKSLPVIDPSPFAAQPYVEALDYEELARFINGGNHE